MTVAVMAGPGGDVDTRWCHMVGGTATPAGQRRQPRRETFGPDGARGESDLLGPRPCRPNATAVAIAEVRSSFTRRAFRGVLRPPLRWRVATRPRSSLTCPVTTRASPCVRTRGGGRPGGLGPWPPRGRPAWRQLRQPSVTGVPTTTGPVDLRRWSSIRWSTKRSWRSSLARFSHPSRFRRCGRVSSASGRVLPDDDVQVVVCGSRRGRAGPRPPPDGRARAWRPRRAGTGRPRRGAWPRWTRSTRSWSPSRNAGVAGAVDMQLGRDAVERPLVRAAELHDLAVGRRDDAFLVHVVEIQHDPRHVTTSRSRRTVRGRERRQAAFLASGTTGLFGVDRSRRSRTWASIRRFAARP